MTVMPIRVLYVHGTAAIGGAETDLLSIIRELDRTKFEVFVACPGQGPFVNKVEELGIPVWKMNFPAWRKLKDIGRIPWCVFTLIRLIKRWNIELIHVNDYWWAPMVWRASQIRKVPFIVHIRQQIESRRIKQYGLARPELLVAVSDDIRRVVIQNGVSADAIQVVHSGIELSQRFDSLNGEAIRERYHLQSHQPVIGTIGNLFPRKGHEYLIEAVEDIRKVVPDIFCFIVGTGEKKYTEKIKDMVGTKGLESCFAFVGFQADPLQYLAAFSVFVLPSIIEGFPIVLLEAMAMGKPVVASQVGGVPELVEDGVTGVLVPSGSSESLGKAIITLLRDPETQTRMGKSGKQRVKTLFSLRQSVGKIEELYRSVVSQK